MLAANGALRAMVVYGDDGLDELSTTGPSTVHEIVALETGGYETSQYRVNPADLGFAPAKIDDLRGWQRRLQRQGHLGCHRRPALAPP